MLIHYLLLKLMPGTRPFRMQASLLNFILIQLHNKDVNRQDSQDINDVVVVPFKFWVLNDCRRVGRQMESVQKKNSILVSTYSVLNVVCEKLHELNAHFGYALDLQLFP